MDSTILVTGGTGTLGRRVVARLEGHDVRVLSRRPGPVRWVGDLEYGTAGAVAAWTAAGKRVTSVMVTQGEAGIDAIPPEAIGFELMER